MRFNELQTGTRFELALLNNLGEMMDKVYVSQLLEPVTGVDMVISAPIFESRVIFIPLNYKFNVVFFHKRYGLMGFTAVATAREFREKIAIMKVRAVSELERIQRRKHFRLDSVLNSEFRVLNSPREAAYDDKLFKATVKNISGSGICIVTGENIPKNSVLELFVDLNASAPVRAVGVVLRNQQVEVKRDISYELGLHFSEISQRDQDAIIKYIFEQQRLLLKKDVRDN